MKYLLSIMNHFLCFYNAFGVIGTAERMEQKLIGAVMHGKLTTILNDKCEVLHILRLDS